MILRVFFLPWLKSANPNHFLQRWCQLAKESERTWCWNMTRTEALKDLVLFNCLNLKRPALLLLFITAETELQKTPNWPACSASLGTATLLLLCHNFLKLCSLGWLLPWYQKHWEIELVLQVSAPPQVGGGVGTEIALSFKWGLIWELHCQTMVPSFLWCEEPCQRVPLASLRTSDSLHASPAVCTLALHIPVAPSFLTNFPCFLCLSLT